jgi:hypothetical protein
VQLHKGDAMRLDDEVSNVLGIRNLHGEVLPADTYKRNGRPLFRYDRDGFEAVRSHTDNGAKVLRVLSRGLTKIERRTWWRILDGWSIDAIAEADGVRRAAIYARIRGTRGTGGMVRKNAWVARWWNRRQHERP